MKGETVPGPARTSCVKHGTPNKLLRCRRCTQASKIQVRADAMVTGTGGKQEGWPEGEDTGEEFGSKGAPHAQSSFPGPCRKTPLAATTGGLPGQDLLLQRMKSTTKQQPTSQPWQKPLIPSSETPWTIREEFMNYIKIFQMGKQNLMSSAWKSAWAFPGGPGQIRWCPCKWKMTLRGISHYVRYTCTLFSRARASSRVQSLRWHGASLTLIWPCRCKGIFYKSAQTPSTLPLRFICILVILKWKLKPASVHRMVWKFPKLLHLFNCVLL